MRFLLASIVLLWATLGSAQAPSAIVTDPPPPVGFASWQEVGQAQLPLAKAADEISVVLGMMPTRAGFSALEVDLNSVFVYWKASEQVAAPVVAAVEAVRARGISVQFREAPFSLDELIAESARVRAEAGTAFVSTSHLPHGAGIHIKTNSAGDLSTVPFVIASRSRLAALAKGARALSDVVVSKAEPPAEFTRTSDYSPYYSGAQTTGGSAGLCSSGFSVYNGGYRYMLSAGHCTGWQNGIQIKNGVGANMGQSWYAAETPFDTALVSVPNNSAFMYSGGVGSGEFSIHVVGQISTAASYGLYVCTSGAPLGFIAVSTLIALPFSGTIGLDTTTARILMAPSPVIQLRPGMGTAEGQSICHRHGCLCSRSDYWWR